MLIYYVAMKLPEIIGIAGTNGAGKDELADLRPVGELTTVSRLKNSVRKKI